MQLTVSLEIFYKAAMITLVVEVNFRRKREFIIVNSLFNFVNYILINET
jgi:hypothetical protein